MVPAMDVPIIQTVSNIACIPVVAFVLKLIVSIIEFSFLSLINKFFITTKINISREIGHKTLQVAKPNPERAILNF